MKKLISMLAVLCLLVVLLPVSALAEETVDTGTWPDELPIVGLFENELERDCDDTAVDGDSIDFGSSDSRDAFLELSRDYDDAEIETPLDTVSAAASEPVSQTPVAYTAAPKVVVEFFQEFSMSSFRQDILESVEGMKLTLSSFGR